LTASYQINASELIIGPVSSTRKLCPEEDLMTQEQQLLQALTLVTHYQIRARTNTRRRRLPASIAHINPDAPAPIIITSTSSIFSTNTKNKLIKWKRGLQPRIENFTNYTVEAENFISENAHFCKSALSRFTQWDFLEMIHAQNIPYHEREHGQLFCNESARDILNMLRKCEARQHCKFFFIFYV
jgi:hypothetical protein